MSRVLLPYFNAGFGHISFARAIQAEIARRRPDWETRLMDAGAELPGKRLTSLYVTSWQRILAQPEWIKNALFSVNNSIPAAFALLNRRAVREALPGLKLLLDEWTPDAVVPTHWGCGHLFAAARKRYGFRFPIAYLYTELQGAYKQIPCGADRYFCLTAEAKEALARVGAPAGSIEVVDLIVQEELSGPLPDRGESRRSLGLAEERFTVLFSLGGEGIGTAFPFLDHYYAHGRQAQLLVLTGKNRDLLAEVTRRYPAHPGNARIVPVGFLPDLRTAFAASDLLVGKCGTSFAVESIRARKPLLVSHIGAPNEADNRDYMVAHGYASYSARPAELTARIENLAGNESLYEQALAPFGGVPGRNGAERIVDYLITMLEPEKNA